MGRPERPVDPEAGPVQRLAHELRELRRAGGSPSYRDMARTAGFAVTTLSQAAAGERLPSLAVVRGYVRACGGDPAEWEVRWKEVQAQTAAMECVDGEEASPPYRGLARFEPHDHGLYFGRERLVGELAELVCGHRFAAVFGASGSGKSSLLRAGLIPRLRKEIADRGRPAVLRVLTPGDRPATTYGHLLAPAEGEPESWVLFDQFEEVFTLCRDRAERSRFIDLLLAARDPRSPLRVLIVVRADFYSRCGEHRELAEALHGAGLLVGPMTAEELREAVTRPAQAVGLLVERELTARIVEEVLDEPGGLPMLSHAMLETWKRRRGRMLTLASYEAAGGVRGAIAASAERVYEELTPDQACAARQLLLRLVEPGRGAPDTRRPLTVAERDEWVGPDVPVVVERLARARLLTVDEEGVHLAHEALMTCWPRLQGWIQQDRERLRHHRALTEAARAWLEHDRDPGALYRGSRLTLAEELFPDPVRDHTLTLVEREFLLAAFAAREAERRAAVRSAHRARSLTAAVSAFLAVALIAGFVAWQQHRDNQRQTTDTVARRVAEIAESLRTTDPRTAQLLGVAAWRIAPLPESRRALIGALAQPETDSFTDSAAGNGSSRFLVDSGRTLLSAEGRTWRTWDVADHRQSAQGRLPDGEVFSAGPDGRMLAISGEHGMRLWDRRTGRWSGPPLRADDAVDLDASGRGYLTTSLGDDRVELRAVTDGRLLFETRAGDRANVAASADEHLVAVCPTGQAPQVWDVAGHRRLSGGWDRSGASCDDRNSAMVFGGGGRLAVVSDHEVRVWDTTSGRQVADLDVPGVLYAAFNKDGSFLATADGDEISAWRLSSPAEPVFRHPLDNQDLYGGLAWDPARPLLRYLEAGTTHTLDLTSAVTSAWNDEPVDAVLLSPDGRTLATAERSGSAYRFQLRDTRDGHVVRTLPSPPPPPPAPGDPADAVAAQGTKALMAFSPEGTSLAYGVSGPGQGAASQRLTLWDLTRRRTRTTLDLTEPSPDASVATVALGPGGRDLYAVRLSDGDGLNDEVWDVARRRRTAVFPGSTDLGLAVRPDGRLLLRGDRAVRLPSGSLTLHNLVGGDRVADLAFAPDGSRLAAGDVSGRVTLWDGDLEHRAGVLRNVFPTAAGDMVEQMSALALSPDGRTLAVGGDAGTLQLWDLGTRQPLGGPLSTPGEKIGSLAFSPDSTTLYAAGPHALLQRYPVDPTRAVTRVCARAGGATLTRAQWRLYASEVPYRRVCGG
ncbi:nSTAND1 domain-containing NTPase [Streptomyces geranii]|uniref:nSTAND1 domain-containing NTPase n=1 Tax=Streptomyces geranii TaxID=2058923 RepID=UPI000D03C299|nr:hypothetical protein [Streptomyces geranii]